MKNVTQKFPDKIKSMKQKATAKVKACFQWCKENPTEAIAVSAAAIGFLTAGIKAVGKNHSLHVEEDLKNLYCYDRSLGHYWRLKRKLSNREWLDINRRREDGECLGDILESMRLLK